MPRAVKQTTLALVITCTALAGCMNRGKPVAYVTGGLSLLVGAPTLVLGVQDSCAPGATLCYLRQDALVAAGAVLLSAGAITIWSIFDDSIPK
jgi:hypothetical protein